MTAYYLLVVRENFPPMIPSSTTVEGPFYHGEERERAKELHGEQGVVVVAALVGEPL